MFFISCGGGDSGLKGELDDVKDELEQYKGEYDDLTGFVNTVDDDLSNIIKTQGELDNSIIDGGEISGSQMDRITGNIQKLERALNNANQNVANLEKKLQSANSANRTLRKSIANYKKQLAGKEKEIKEYKAKIEALKKEGINPEVIDLRTVRPIDYAAVVKSVKKTNRLVILEEAWPFGSVSSEITFRVQDEAFDYLDAPIKRITTADTPAPYSPVLLEEWLPNAKDVVKAVKDVLYINK